MYQSFSNKRRMQSIRWGRYAILLAVIASIIAASWGIHPAQAAPPVVQTFYVPITEPQARTWMQAQASTQAYKDECNTIYSGISITGTFNGTTLYYDHWEDGYEEDISNPQQSTTEVFTIDAGQVITLEQDIPLVVLAPNPPGTDSIRDQGNVYYDAMDKIAVTQQAVVTRAFYPNGAPQTIGTQLAGAVEVFDTSKWGSSFEVPVGDNLGLSSFNYTAVSVTAQKNGTSVTVRNPDNSVNVTQTLNEGQTLYVAGIDVGATVTSTGGPVQVDVMTGRIASNFEGRLYSLLPIDKLGNSYYSPVSTTIEADGSPIVYNDLIAYNPNATSITINITCMTGTTNCPGSQTLAAHTAGIFRLPLEPTSPNTLTGAKLFSSGGQNFYAIALVDRSISTTTGQVHNWGFNMVPETSLTTSVVVGLSPGTTDRLRDANPIWVTPVASTTIYVDYDGDPLTGTITDSLGNRCDQAIPVTALEAQKIFSPGPYYDHTGWRVYTTDYTRIAVAYGQDGGSSSGNQPTELDLGTAVLPFPSLVAYKSSTLLGDFNDNGGIDPGELLEYTIKVHNSGIIPISNMNLLDTLDANTTYVADTTTMAGNPLADNLSGTRFPLDETGYAIPGTLLPGQEIVFTFHATVNNPLNPTNTTELINIAKVSSIAEIFLNARTSIVQQGILSVQKTSSAAPNSVKPGDIINYTVTVTNTSTTPQTGISVTDDLPDGTSYVANSTSVTGHRQKLVVDKFNSLSYSVNDGPENWAASWLESDASQNATAGNVQVTSGALRLTANGSWASRAVNLTTGIPLQNFTSAILTFNYRTSPAVVAADAVIVQAYGNGNPWTTLPSGTLTGFVGQTTGSSSYDISAYIGSDTAVRFSISGGYTGASDFFYVDNVAIKSNELAVSVTKDNIPGATYPDLVSGVPPTMVRQDDGFALAAGENMTITYSVQANTPVNETRIVNTATATSYEKAPPASATTIDPVSGGGTIGDLVWLDTIKNGVYDTAEPGLYNVRVWLDTDNDGVFTAGTDFETRTGTDGKYIFEGLLPGTYRVYVDAATLPLGISLATPPPASVTITLEETFLNNDFGYQTDPTKAVIGNYIWSDANNNGMQDSGEIGIAGVTVELRQGGTTVTTTTDAFGSYLFTNVTPRTYTIVVTDTANKLGGYSPTSGLQSLGIGVNIPSSPLDVTAGNSFMMMDTGFRNASLHSISDKLWFDSDNNGSLDAGEPGIKDVTITLLDTNGLIVGSAVTDVNGNFSFTGVPDGSYRIRIEDATGKLIGYAGTTTAAQNGLLPVTVAGSNVSGVSFGYNAPGRIGDTVWRDLNRNGIQDPGEAGIPGVTVTLYKDTNGNGVFDPPTDQLFLTTTTDTAGNYLFQVSEAGRFFVNVDETQSALSGLTLTSGDEEPYQGVQIQVDFLDLNTSLLTADFGFGDLSTPATISGTVWNDTNRNATIDFVETDIQGVAVNLYKDTNGDGIFNPAVDQLISTVFTDSTGYYEFPVTQAGRFFINVDTNQTPLLGKTLTTGDDQAYAGAQITVNLPTANTIYSNGNFGYAPPAASALSITKTANPSGNVSPGSIITYTVTVTNTSATRQTGIRVDDPLPANTTYVANSTSATGKVNDSGTATLLANMDTYLDQNNPTRNYGTTAQLAINIRTDRSQRPLVRFDLSSIPAGATITSATMGFYVSQANVNITSVNIYRLTQTWVEGTHNNQNCTNDATWNTYNCTNNWSTAGGDYNATVIGSFVPNSTGYKNVDVTSLVQGWYSGTNSNYGVILIGSNSSGKTTQQAYISSRSVLTQQPRLIVNYTISTITKNNGPGPNLLSNGVPPNLVVPADGFILDQNDTLTVTHRVTVNNPLPDDVVSIINQATATSNESGPALASVTNLRPTLQDLQVTKVIETISNPCSVGTCQVTYLVTVSNVGTNAETAVFVTDVLPTELTYLSHVASQGTYTNATGIWSVGNISSGNSATLRITATVTTDNSSIQNCASLTASTPADTNPANNTGCADLTPTYVFLSSFTAYEDSGRTVIKWTTSSETGTAGFYLFRKDEAAGDYIRINNRLLPALLTSPQGGTYSLIDNSASPDVSYTYVLVEIERRGSKKAYGPFTVQARKSLTGDELGLSKTIDPYLLAYGKALGSAEKANTRASSENISAHPDKNGVLIVTNKNGIQKNSRSGTDLFSRYTRTPAEPSADRKARLEELKETEIVRAAGKKSVIGKTLKIAINKNGLYYLDASQISALMGLPKASVVTLIAQNGFTLSNQGSNVSYTAGKGNSGILFYGQSMNSIYASDNIYWLSQGNGSSMKVVNGSGPASSPAAGTFTETIHSEEDNRPDPGLFSDPEADYWFWDYIVSGDPYDGAKTFALQADGLATSAPATLTVNLYGFSDTRHRVRLTLKDGTVIGEGPWEWDGMAPGRFTTEIPAGLLHEGNNDIVVEGVFGDDFDIFYVDSFDLSYQRTYQAVDNALAFSGGQNSLVTVTGFTNPDILLFDITNPRKPRIIRSTTISGSTGNSQVSFVPASPSSLYLALTSDAATAVANIKPDEESALRTRNSADYLIITTPQMKATASSLATYRRGQGLTPMVVLLEDIMDEFNFGISSPKAVRDFLSYASMNWKKSPRYVLLAGNGTFDYKNNQGKGDNLIPTLMSATPYGLSATDNLFADYNGDHVPEIALGRLPVLTAGDLQNVISKIIGYEGSTGNRIIMAADNGDGAGNFREDSNEVLSLISQRYSAQTIYLDEHPIVEARYMLMSGINQGVVYVNYIGHGGVDILARNGLNGLLLTGDIGDMKNSGKLFVMAAMTCSAGQYAVPGYDSLSESLVVKKDVGAAAVWSPTGMSLNSFAKILDEEFVKAALGNNKAVLGDAIVTALKNYSAIGGPLYIMDIYNLLGDPALKMR